MLTPLLVLFFRVSPLTAISSDLLISLVMKPWGGAVHLRHRTVNWRLIGLLAVGSMPAAFAGAILISAIAHRAGVQDDLKMIIGVALCAAVALMVLRQLLDRRARRRDAKAGMPEGAVQPLIIRPRPGRRDPTGDRGGAARGRLRKAIGCCERDVSDVFRTGDVDGVSFTTHTVAAQLTLPSSQLGF